MTELQEGLLARIAALLATPPQIAGRDLGSELHMSTISIATLLYGGGSPQVAAIVQAKADIRASSWGVTAKETRLVEDCHGALRAMAADISGGLLRKVRLDAQAEVFADFLQLAKAALESDAKDVASVLASAALEDALKKLAVSAGLTVDDRDMSDVVNALKSAGQINAAQGALLKGFVQIRNRSLHAEWTKIDRADVQALVAFTEQFILTRL
ncbi:MAG: DUF4145 domain-containing protein [Gemmatimonadota bacterium]